MKYLKLFEQISEVLLYRFLDEHLPDEITSYMPSNYMGGSPIPFTGEWSFFSTGVQVEFDKNIDYSNFFISELNFYDILIINIFKDENTYVKFYFCVVDGKVCEFSRNAYCFIKVVISGENLCSGKFFNQKYSAPDGFSPMFPSWIGIDADLNSKNIYDNPLNNNSISKCLIIIIERLIEIDMEHINEINLFRRKSGSNNIDFLKKLYEVDLYRFLEENVPDEVPIFHYIHKDLTNSDSYFDKKGYSGGSDFSSRVIKNTKLFVKYMVVSIFQSFDDLNSRHLKNRNTLTLKFNESSDKYIEVSYFINKYGKCPIYAFNRNIYEVPKSIKFCMNGMQQDIRENCNLDIILNVVDEFFNEKNLYVE